MNNHTIGFIGLGNMGKPIFDNISKSMKNLYCFDQHNSKGSSLYKFTDTKKIFEVCNVIIFCIKTNKEIYEILKKNKIKDDTIFLDLTTSLPDVTIEINSYLEKFNSYYIDAGMSGGASGALNATLSLMVGGNKSKFEEINYILKTFALNIFYLGKSGNGHMMKLLHNSVCHSIFLLNCEILNIAKNFDLNEEDVINVFNKSNARSYISEKRFPDNILSGKFNGKSTINNLKKDLNMISSILEKTNLDMSYTKLSTNILNKIDDNYNDDDFTTIYKNWSKYNMFDIN